MIRFPFVLHRAAALGALMCFAASSSLAAEPGVVKSEFLYDDAPHPECHATTIEETPHGLVAAWFGGTHEKHPDVGIWVARQVDGQWTAGVEVADGVQYTKPDGSVHRHPCWNPVLFQPKDGPLMLFYKVGPDPRQWWGMLMTSDDGGQTWSQPRRLPEGIDGPVKNKPLQLANGDILCGSSTEAAKHEGWRLHMERTSDLGRTWPRTEALNDGKTIGAIQPSLLQLADGRLLAVGRTQREERIFRIASHDGGKTWGELELTSLPNPNSGTDALTLADGRHLIVYNHTGGRRRSPLNVAISDDAERWQAAVALETEPGEYSYPAIIQTSDGLVHITYTWKRQRVKHVVLDPAKLVPREMVDGAWPEL